MNKKQWDVFFEIQQDLPRQGPGSAASTRRAFSLLRHLTPEPAILDVGCGPGAQTLDLARLTDGTLVAVDNHEPYLDQLREQARAEGFAGRIDARLGDMFALDVPEESFDVVWAEGSIYIIGFERGLTEWSVLIKPGGYVAVSEMTWLSQDTSQEVRSFWNEAYPAMQDVAGNLRILEGCGFDAVGHFVLPESDFWDDYYNPLEARLGDLRRKYAGDSEALEVIGMTEQEIDLYRRYSKDYGYVFYVGRKT